MAALKYARASFGPLGESNLDGIQRLMGHLCFLKRSGAGPYSDLASVKLWDEVARDFTRHCCGLLGQVGSPDPCLHLLDSLETVLLLLCLWHSFGIWREVDSCLYRVAALPIFCCQDS